MIVEFFSAEIEFSVWRIGTSYYCSVGNCQNQYEEVDHDDDDEKDLDEADGEEDVGEDEDLKDGDDENLKISQL